jgi:hypothetical protein
MKLRLPYGSLFLFCDKIFIGEVSLIVERLAQVEIEKGFWQGHIGKSVA